MLPRAARRLGTLMVVLAACGSLTAWAQPASTTSTPVPLTGEVREGKLANGLRYFIRHNERPQGRAELRLVVNAGSILEDDDQLGAAHFIEHMSFNGTKKYPKNELVSYLQSVGVRLGGDLNASTGFDETIYILPIPVGDREVFATGLAILREWAGNALLNDADVDSERAVVLAELRSGLAADERVRRQTMPRMFNGSRYAVRQPIGTEQSLRRMTPEALRRFYKDSYVPTSRASLSSATSIRTRSNRASRPCFRICRRGESAAPARACRHSSARHARRARRHRLGVALRAYRHHRVRAPIAVDGIRRGV